MWASSRISISTVEMLESRRAELEESSASELEALLYTLKLHGYRGHFGIDINPERMPVEVGIKNSMDALRAANDRINALDHGRIVEATMKSPRTRSAPRTTTGRSPGVEGVVIGSSRQLEHAQQRDGRAPPQLLVHLDPRRQVAQREVDLLDRAL